MSHLSVTVILAAGWVDLGQHLVQIWRWVEAILHAYNLMVVGLAQSSFPALRTPSPNGSRTICVLGA